MTGSGSHRAQVLDGTATAQAIKAELTARVTALAANGVVPGLGTVLVGGLDVAADTIAVKRLVGYCPDVGGLVPRATPWEHLQLSAALRRMDAWEEPGRDLLEKFGLGDVALDLADDEGQGGGERVPGSGHGTSLARRSAAGGTGPPVVGLKGYKPLTQKRYL